MLGPMTLEGGGMGCPGQFHLELVLGVLTTHGTVHGNAGNGSGSGDGRVQWKWTVQWKSAMEVRR